MAAASPNVSVGGTFVRDTIPRVRAAPGLMMTVSNVPSMFWKRLRVSRFVAAPTESSTVSEQIPTVTPAIMRTVRTLALATPRHVRVTSLARCMSHDVIRHEHAFAQHHFARRAGSDGVVVRHQHDGAAFVVELLKNHEDAIPCD